MTLKNDSMNALRKKINEKEWYQASNLKKAIAQNIPGNVDVFDWHPSEERCPKPA